MSMRPSHEPVPRPRRMGPVVRVGAAALLAGAGLAAVLPLPGSLVAQELGVGLPAEEDDAAHDVLSRLYRYYHWSTRWNLSHGFGPVCDADRGDRCFEGDHESYCWRISCHRETQKADFVRTLAELAREHPESPHAVGHAVYAAVRLERYGVAAEVVELCAPLDRWWCHLARGYLLHRTRRSAEAEEPLRRGLEAAPPDLRCRLEDVAYLLPDEARERYEAIPCGERAAFHRHVWWLADPFYVDREHDRWAEHVARRFALLLHEHRLEATRMGGGGGTVHPVIHEVEVVRRGFQDSWDLARVEGLRWGVAERFGYTSRSGAANHFVPDRFSLTGLSDSVDWRLEAELGDEGYTRPDGAMQVAPVQVARFMEDDSLVVALASDLRSAGLVETVTDPGRPREEDAPPLPEGIVVREGPLREVMGIGRAHFVTSEGPDHVAALDPAPVRERVVFAATVPDRLQVAGLEVFSPGGTARHREVVSPLRGHEPVLSDLLLFRPFGLELPATRERAIALMYGSARIPRDRDLGVYWEAYGLPGDESVEVSVTLEGDDDGWLTRLGRAVGVGGGRPDRTISWTEETGEARPFAQSFTLRLGGVEEGEVALTLRVDLGDGRILSRTRRLELVESEEPRDPGPQPAPPTPGDPGPRPGRPGSGS